MVCALNIPKVNDYGGIQKYFSKLDGIDEYDVSLRITGTTLEGINVSGIGYSSNVSTYQPKLKKGVWYTKADEGEYLPVVITETVAGYDVGDVLELKSNSDDVENQKFVVCGILQNGASFYDIGYFKRNSTTFDYFTPYDSDYDDTLNPMMFFSKENAEKLGYEGFCDGRIIIKYSDDLSQEEIEEYDEILKAEMGEFSDKISDVRTRTEKK